MKVTASLIALFATLCSSVTVDVADEFIKDPSQPENLITAFQKAKITESQIKKLLDDKSDKNISKHLFAVIMGTKYDESYEVMAKDRGMVAPATVSANLQRFSTQKNIPDLPDAYCENLALYIDLFRNNQLVAMKNSCRKLILNKLTASITAAKASNATIKIEKKVLDSIPASWFLTHAKDIYELVKVSDARINDLNANLVQSIFSAKSAEDYPNLIGDVGANALTFISRSLANKVAPEAFAAMKKTIPDTSIANINYFSDEILSFYDGALNEVTLKKVTADQIRNYAQKIDSDDVGVNLDLKSLGENIKNINPRVLFGYFSKENQSPLGAAWKKLPAGIFATAGDRLQAIFENIPASDLEMMSLEVVETVDLSKRIISSEILVNLNGVIAARYLVKGRDLLDNILSHFDATTIKNLTFPGTKQTLTGLEVLTVPEFKTKPNVAKIIAEMSSNASEHACGSIDNSNDFFKNSVLMNNLTHKCLEALSFEFTESELVKYPALFSHLPMDKVNAIYEEKAKQMNATQIAALSLNSELTKLNEEMLAVMDKKVLVAFTPKAVLTLRQKLIKDMIPFLAVESFSLFTATDFDGLRFGLSDLSKEQLARVSSQITDSATSAISRFGASEVAALQGAVSAMSPQQIAFLPGKFINEAQFKALEPKSMTKMTAAQVLEISPEILVLITKAQMEAIGTGVEPSVSPLIAFKDLASRLTKESRTAYEKRSSPGNSANVVGFSSVAVIFTAIAAVVLSY